MKTVANDWRALSRAEWIALVLAVAIAQAFIARTLAYPPAFDAANYLDIGEDIGRNGVLSNYGYSELRPYGYPSFLAAMRPLADAAGIGWRLAIMEAQLAMYVAAALFMRRAIAPLSIATARIALVTLVLDVIALAYVAETLTESLSLTLLVVAAACWAHGVGRSRLWPVALGSVAVGFAIVVRPANVFALPGWAIALAVAGAVHRWRAGRTLVVAVVAVIAVAAPLLPQVANNVRHHGTWTPLVAADLGRNQQIWGITNLKYATALPPAPAGAIRYPNPFAQDRRVDEQRPLAWYAHHPAAGIATLALHAFGMLDQDLVFTYARDLDPWYRVPVGVVTHGFVALAVLGALLLARQARRSALQRAVLVALVAFAGGHVALHSVTAVEMRFGLPLLALAAPLGTWFVAQCWPRAGARRRAVLAAFVSAWIVASLALSHWIREQSPEIRAWQAAVQPDRASTRLAAK